MTAIPLSPSKGSADSTRNPSLFRNRYTETEKKMAILIAVDHFNHVQLGTGGFDLHNTAHLSNIDQGARHADWLHLSKKR